MTAPFFIRPLMEIRLEVIDARRKELAERTQQAMDDIAQWQELRKQLYKERQEIAEALAEGKVSI